MSMQTSTIFRTGLIAILSMVLAGAAVAQIASEPSPFETDNPNAVVPGELFTEPPTLINLGFEWLIQGDDNRNASVSVWFREQGTTEWRDGLPLLRLNGERVFSESRVDVIVPNMFAGSVLDLKPDTDYETRFIINDPDGVIGNPERLALVRTRAEPQPYAGGRVLHVYPHG